MSDLGDFADHDADDPSDSTPDDSVTSTPTNDDPTNDDPTNDDTDAFENRDLEDTGRDHGLGALAVSEGLRVHEDGQETALKAYVTTGNRSAVRLGTYLVAPYPRGEKLFCKITGLEYVQAFQSDDATEIHARRAMRSDGVDEHDYKFLAELDPVAVLYSDGAGRSPAGSRTQSDDGGELKRRMPDRVPKPETVVRQADDATEIKTGLKIPEDGVFLGHLSVGGEKVRTATEPPTIDYRVKDDYEAGDPLVFRHTLIAGGTGSGKTHSAKNILRQYLHEDRRYPVDTGGAERRLAVVQFDPQDEYAQMHDDNPEADASDERAWETQGVAHGGHDDTVAFVPKVGSASYAADHHGAEQVEFTVPFSMVRDNPWLVASSDLNDNQYGALYFLLDRFFDQHGTSGTYREFCAFLDDPALKEELDDTGRVHEATYEAVLRRVHGMPSGLFDQDARSIIDLVEDRRFVRPGRLSVVPTYHISNSRAAETVVLAVSSLLVDQKLSNDPTYESIKETPLLVGMDEAHNFLADADSVQASKVVGKFTEAAKQGRKERLGLFLVTQDPQDVADPVFKQVNTTVVLNLGDEDAINAVNIPSSLQSKVPYMEKGQMVVYSPDNSESVEIQGLPTCLTRHGRD